MIPKEKAKILYAKFRGFNNETPEINKNSAIQCALITVDEIIQDYKNSIKAVPEFSHFYFGGLTYWQDVKKEIEKL